MALPNILKIASNLWWASKFIQIFLPDMCDGGQNAWRDKNSIKTRIGERMSFEDSAISLFIIVFMNQLKFSNFWYKIPDWLQNTYIAWISMAHCLDQDLNDQTIGLLLTMVSYSKILLKIKKENIKKKILWAEMEIIPFIHFYPPG